MFTVPHHDEATATVQPVQLIDALRLKSTDIGYKSTRTLLMFTPTITICLYCSSRKFCTDMLVLHRKLRQSKLPQEDQSC